MPSAGPIVKNRFLGFLIWQGAICTAVFVIFKTFLSPLTTAANPLKPSLLGGLAFIAFHTSLLFFSSSLFVISSPEVDRAASPFELALGLIRFAVVSGEFTPDFRRQARISLAFTLFVTTSAVSGFASLVFLCLGYSETFGGVGQLIGGVGFRGFLSGILYAGYYVLKRRWVLEFPIIQRPPFFSFKMRLPTAIRGAWKLSCVIYLCIVPVAIALQDQLKNHFMVGKFISEELIIYIGSFAVFLCWELCHHLNEVLHTKRHKFAPSKGSAAAETNPSEMLLQALEGSPPSLLRHLAFLDLCMVCERNIDTWRRAAFFEESGETYKRAVAVCLRPLTQLASELGEDMEHGAAEKAHQLSYQLQPPGDSQAISRLSEMPNNIQLCTWCARAVAALTVHSHKEDKYGVAQLSGSNAAVISTLLSCLLAVEALTGKKTHVQSSAHPVGPAGIKWATPNTGRREAAAAASKKKGDGLRLRLEAHAMADVFRTCIYCVVCAFLDEMSASAKSGLLDKDWIAAGEPVYGERELLRQKLLLFLEFRAI